MRTIFLVMQPVSFSPIVRLGVRPDEEDVFAGPRPRGSRRPHADARVAAVRRLIEQTALTYSEIAAKTGVGRASICRWTRDGGWQRPAFAPRATDRVPTARASARLKRRTLAARLSALAERHIRELEETPRVDPERLAEALELLKMAKLAARPKQRRVTRSWLVSAVSSPHGSATLSPLFPAQAGTQGPHAHDPAMTRPPRGRDGEAGAGTRRMNPYDEAVLRVCGELPGSRPARRPQGRPAAKLPAEVLADLRAAGIEIDRAPPAAVADFVASCAAPRADDAALRPRGQRSRRNREHARMLERER